MTDRLDINRSARLVDPVDDAKITAMGAVQPLELEPKRPADLLRVQGDGAVYELDCRRGDLFRNPT